jgi:PhnB protein
MRLYTQLNFGGNCREAFRFYEQHLGGKVTVMMSRSEAPGLDPGAPGGSQDAIIHARVTIGQTELIGNDVPAETFQPIRSAYLYLAVDSAEEAERVFAVLKDQGQVYMPLAETFFASRFAMLRDRFGTSWTVICEKAQPRPN